MRAWQKLGSEKWESLACRYVDGGVIRLGYSVFISRRIWPMAKTLAVATRSP